MGEWPEGVAVPAPLLLSPCDLAGQPARTGVRVGGRAYLRDGRSVLLTDAFARISVTLAGEAEIEVGDLLLLQGDWTGSVLTATALLTHTKHPAPSGGGELAALVLEGGGAWLRAHARARELVREFFGERGFLEVTTPTRVPAPGVDYHVDALFAEGGFLVTSPEHHMKRLLVGGVPRLFQLARVFRADESGPLHEPEFTLLEWYRAFAGLDAILADTEALVRHVVVALSGSSRVLVRGREVDVAPAFTRLTVRQAFQRHADVEDAARLAADDEDRYFELMVSRVEPALAHHPRPVFLTEYPISQAALSRPLASDPSVAERAELYFGGIELCNAYGELTCPSEQRRRFTLEAKRREAAGRRVYPLDEPFLAALAEGMPPAGGNALGLERLVMVATGATSIRGARQS